MHARRGQLGHIKPLRKRADFLTVAGKGRKWVAQGMIVQIRPNDLDHHRVGFTVTKKTDPKATNRNRIKRRLRAAAADILQHPLHPPVYLDIVLIGRTASTNRPYSALARDLAWCLEKMGHARARETKVP